MKVKRVVTDLSADNVEQVKHFYSEVLGLELLMDLGWIMSFGSGDTMPIQFNIGSEGGSGTPMPNMSIEVDDLDEVLRRVRTIGATIEYGPVEEPWGVRRFYVLDPAGNLLNILQH